MVEPYKPLYTVKQAASVLLVNTDTVYRYKMKEYYRMCHLVVRK